MTNKAKPISINILIQRYKKELEELKKKEQTERTEQTICVLREVCLDLELIMGATNG